jgi:MinD-like ATPase involved in chromosome partitioning or flagellar assembly
MAKEFPLIFDSKYEETLRLTMEDFGMEPVKDRVWAVGESKGDTRKNFIASKIGCGLALRGYEVVLVAADSEGWNMHAQFGIPAPEVLLEDYLSNRVLQLSDVLYPTSKNKLRLICAGSKSMIWQTP